MSMEYFKNDNIVSLGPIRSRVNFGSISQVEAYWEGLRDGRPMPMRSEVDPRGISDVLEFAFILEQVAPGLARIRLAGMHLSELMAMEVRGMPITAMFLPEARAELQRLTQDVMENPAVVRLALTSDSGIGRPVLDAQMILLPMRDAQGNVTRILGALQANCQIGRGPRRFAIRDVETKAIPMDDAHRHPVHDTALPARAPAMAPAPGPGLRLVYDADRV